MDAKLKANWVKALRSGEYTQVCHGIGNVKQKALCCLGVGAAVAKPDIYLDNTTQAIEELCKYGFDGLFGPENDTYTETAKHLIDLNDIAGKTFSEIADYIEQNL